MTNQVAMNIVNHVPKVFGYFHNHIIIIMNVIGVVVLYTPTTLILCSRIYFTVFVHDANISHSFLMTRVARTLL